MHTLAQIQVLGQAISLHMCHLCCLPQSQQLSNPTTKKGWPCMLFLKKTLPEWHPTKTFHYIILQNPPRWFYLHLSEYISPPKKNKSHSTFFLLNCMTSSIQVTKRGKKTCILKRRIAQSSFIMYIYANSTLVYSRKSLSLLLSLPPGQCVSIRQYVWKAVADRVGESWMV